MRNVASISRSHEITVGNVRLKCLRTDVTVVILALRHRMCTVGETDVLIESYRRRSNGCRAVLLRRRDLRLRNSVARSGVAVALSTRVPWIAVCWSVTD